MKHRIRVFVLTCLTLAAVSRTPSAPAACAPSLAIPFELNRKFGSILIRVEVNGRPAWLLVDTGSSHTILSAEIVGVNPLFLARATVPVKGSGLVGLAGWGAATIELGTIKWANRRVLVMEEFREISKGMKQRVDGILGEDLLNEFASVVLDYKNHRLILQR
jgi:Aspartyl protease